MAISDDDKQSLQFAKDQLKVMIRKLSWDGILTAIGLIEGTLERLRRGDKEIEGALSEINWRAEARDKIYEKELQERFKELEGIMIRKFGLALSK